MSVNYNHLIELCRNELKHCRECISSEDGYYPVDNIIVLLIQILKELKTHD